MLALRKKVQGADHYQTVVTQCDLQTLRVIAALKAGDCHSFRATTGKWREAQQLESKYRFALALPIRKDILDIHRRVFGEDHPDTATSCNSVAFNLHALGNVAEAALLFRKALDIRFKILGEEHSAVAPTILGPAALAQHRPPAPTHTAQPPIGHHRKKDDFDRG